MRLTRIPKTADSEANRISHALAISTPTKSITTTTTTTGMRTKGTNQLNAK